MLLKTMADKILTLFNDRYKPMSCESGHKPIPGQKPPERNLTQDAVQSRSGLQEIFDKLIIVVLNSNGGGPWAAVASTRQFDDHARPHINV